MLDHLDDVVPTQQHELDQESICPEGSRVDHKWEPMICLMCATLSHNASYDTCDISMA